MAAAEHLIISSYHDAPPFLINPQHQSGLNQDFVNAIAPMLAPDYTVELKLINRPQLNEQLTNDQPAIVLWAHPDWFTEHPLPLYWAGPLFSDREVLIARRKTPKVNPDIAGLTLAARNGYHYQGLDQRVADHSLTRVDFNSDRAMLAEVLVGKADVAVITRSSFVYYVQQPQFLGKLTIVGQPYPDYQRQILLSHHYQTLQPKLQQAIEKLKDDPHWQRRLAVYGLKQ